MKLDLVEVEEEPELPKEILENELCVDRRLTALWKLLHHHMVVIRRKEAVLVVGILNFDEVRDVLH